jgi:hypothetical protein
MRKIETAMTTALRARRAWRDGNTAVELDARQDGKPLAIVRLFGHHIATVGYRVNDDAGNPHTVENITVCLAGWNTTTTRSRLSAIVREFGDCGPNGLGVFSRDDCPSLNDANGSREIDSNGWHAVALKKG